MRAFQPLARRMEAERNRNLWVPPPALRRIAWCILLGSVAYIVVSGWRLASYLFAAQHKRDYAMTHVWHAPPFLMPVVLVVIFLVMRFLIPHGPREKKKHIPDPALSIRPR